MSEDEMEEVLVRQLQDPKNPAHEEFVRKTRQVARLPTDQLVGALNEHLPCSPALVGFWPLLLLSCSSSPPVRAVLVPRRAQGATPASLCPHSFYICLPSLHPILYPHEGKAGTCTHPYNHTYPSARLPPCNLLQPLSCSNATGSPALAAASKQAHTQPHASFRNSQLMHLPPPPPAPRPPGLPAADRAAAGQRILPRRRLQAGAAPLQARGRRDGVCGGAVSSGPGGDRPQQSVRVPQHCRRLYGPAGKPK
jgi:hypothetical protein